MHDGSKFANSTHRIGIVVCCTKNSVDKRTAIVGPSVGQVHKLLESKAGTIVHHLHVSLPASFQAYFNSSIIDSVRQVLYSPPHRQKVP